MINNEQIQDMLLTDEKKLSDFQSVFPKSEGKRWGFIGKIEKEEGMYLVKRELGGYETVTTAVENDMIVLECLSATLIKLILGSSFAAETAPLRLDCETFTRHIKTGEGSELVTETLPVGDFSNYGLFSKILTSDSYQRNKKLISDNDELVKLSLIVCLLGISDVKQEHLICHYKDEGSYLKKHTAIIDCAADLNGHNRSLDFILTGNKKIYPINPKDYGVVLKIFNRIIDIEFHLMHAVDRYKHIQVSELCENSVLKNKLHLLVSHIKNCLPQLETKIQSAILNGDLKLDQYVYLGLARLLERFPEKYRLQILYSNIAIFKKEDEEAQEEILKLLTVDERELFMHLNNKENSSMPSIAESHYSLFNSDKKDEKPPSLNLTAITANGRGQVF
ncbi:Uncharacterised protein [Legionella lansingensis]|uniref:Uncharacterized protein n=1 Tax=Legionella lansingensis TaxID=45067 RepID=A0A0W0VTY5_9GAMM|nr:hypothetical protein [Legionella lansingensis]KTD23521.1 hypothetical protein Llan_0779 [Legionella lansingensis]SNV52058.1 Uncharacterised protein [Legionella lansingensis]